MHVDDPVVRGGLVLDLIDAGFSVGGVDTEYDVVVAVVVAANDERSFSVSCAGSGVRAAVVDDGPPALMELELHHRVRALLRETPPKDFAGPRRPPAPTLRPVLVDRATTQQGREARFVERTAAALADRTALADASDDSVCVDADDDFVRVFFGACDALGAATTDNAVYVVDRASAVSDVGAFVDAVVALRPLPVVEAPPEPAPPAPAPPAPPAPTVVAPVPADPPWLSIGLSAGALARPFAVDPVVAVDVYVPVVDVFAGGTGGAIAIVDVTGAVDPVAIVEGVVAIGAGVSVDVADGVRVGAGVGVGAWLHGWSYDDTDAGLAFDPAVVVPGRLEVEVVDGLQLQLGISAGASSRTRLHTIGSETAWERGPLFLAATVGCTLDLL